MEMKISDKKASAALERKAAKAEKYVNNNQKSDRLIDKADEKINRVKLKGALEYIPTMIALIKSYIKREYSEIPVGTIVSIIGAVIYFVSPIDIIPDFIVGIGYIDDASVVALCCAAAKADLDEYKMWCNKANHSEEEK